VHEAALFGAQNERKRLNPTDRFRAMVAAGDPRAKAVAASVEAVGLEVATGVSARNGAIAAVDTMLAIYDRSGETGLRRVLRFVIDCWGTDSTVLTKHMIFAVERFLTAYGAEFNSGHAMRQFRKLTVDQFVQRGTEVRNLFGALAQETVGISIAKAMVIEYNKHLRGRPRLDIGKLDNIRKARQTDEGAC
jgi:hypothetical protein